MRWFLLLIPLTLFSFQKVTYKFSNDPIDVVIPYHPKDFETINMCIDGIRKNGKNINRIIVVSKEPFRGEVEWFDEKHFPFTKEEIALEIFHGDEQEAQAFLSSPKTRIGWVFQQLVKFYAPFVIPDISPNVLILDSDVIFLKPYEFMSATGQPIFIIGTNDTIEYFDHMARLLPGLHRARMEESGIVHHMLFQKPILEDLFNLIEKHNHTDTWRAMCRCVDLGEIYKSCMSEYEIYFNFVALRTNQKLHKRVNWTEVIPDVPNPEYYKRLGYVFIASQEWYRKWIKEMKK